METPAEEIARRKKLVELVSNPFQQTKFFRSSTLEEIRNKFGNLSQAELEKIKKEVSVAGRISDPVRNHGNIAFADLVDQTGTIQLKAYKNEKFVELDNGDIIGVIGVICKT